MISSSFALFTLYKDVAAEESTPRRARPRALTVSTPGLPSVHAHDANIQHTSTIRSTDLLSPPQRSIKSRLARSCPPPVAVGVAMHADDMRLNPTTLRRFSRSHTDTPTTTVTPPSPTSPHIPHHCRDTLFGFAARRDSLVTQGGPTRALSPGITAMPSRRDSTARRGRASSLLDSMESIEICDAKSSAPRASQANTRYCHTPRKFISI